MRRGVQFPMNANMRLALVLSACLATGLSVSCSHSEKRALGYEDEKATVNTVTGRDVVVPRGWDAKSAAAYLDDREVWWMNWQGAARDHETFCVSCHTVVPYLLSRPTLRKQLGEEGPTTSERRLVANVRRRVEMWKDMAPYYDDQDYGPHKAAESRATEAVLNSFILANEDIEAGKLSDTTRVAFSNMWALQLTYGEAKGAWQWQVFDLKPWESRGSQFYGAALAALAVGTAPESYRGTPEIQANLKMLIDYLKDNANEQSPLNRVTLLWASTKLPGLITSRQEQEIIDEMLAKQQSDGGWSLSSVALTWRDLNLESLFGKWKRDDGTSQEVQSDALATGFILFALEEAGVSRPKIQMKRGLDWLVQHQDRTDGSWMAYSLNKRRVPSSNVGRFMTDAATAFTVLALSETNHIDTSTH
jgi:squalene-hopene/tetraprenyl-beta-curcumene cyclase